MPRTVDNFGGGIGEASLSVLLELWTILGANREATTLSLALAGHAVSSARALRHVGWMAKASVRGSGEPL